MRAQDTQSSKVRALRMSKAHTQLVSPGADHVRWCARSSKWQCHRGSHTATHTARAIAGGRSHTATDTRTPNGTWTGGAPCASERLGLAQCFTRIPSVKESHTLNSPVVLSCLGKECHLVRSVDPLERAFQCIPKCMPASARALHARTHARTHTCMHVYTHARTRTHTCMHVYMHARTHAYRNTLSDSAPTCQIPAPPPLAPAAGAQLHLPPP